MMILLSGHSIPDVARMTPADVDLGHILNSLAYTNRYLGTGKVYTTAQHCCYVAHAYQQRYPTAPPLEWLQALMHDFGEAYVGDVVHPVKIALGGAVERLEWRVLSTIYSALGVPFPSLSVIDQIHEIDIAARSVEVSIIFPPAARLAWFEHFPPPDVSLPPLGPIRSHEASLDLLSSTYTLLRSLHDRSEFQESRS